MDDNESDPAKAPPNGKFEWKIGCVLPVIAAFWVIGATFAVPVGGDRVRYSPEVKWTVTLGHVIALMILLVPFPNHDLATRVVCGGILLWIFLTLAVLWYWN